jgi:glycosyltransferase involved in cell wall biosynthesis
MIKIVHLITGLDTGGAERSLQRLVAGMDRSRFENVVVSLTTRGPLAGPIEASGIRVEALGATAGWGGPRAFGRLVALLRREQPAILQTWFYYPDYAGFHAARLARVPVLLWNVRCAFQRREEQSAVAWWVIGRLVRLSGRPDAIVANSRVGISSHEAHGYRPRRWEFIPNGFDLPALGTGREERARLGRELALPVEAPWVGLVARYHRVKDHPTFLRAAALVGERHPNAHFLLIGRGAEAGNEELVRLMGELGISSRVRLLGERHDVQRITGCLDLAASSSTNEAFCNAIGEAMASRVPCVVTDVGDSADIVGDTGRAVPARNPTAFARALGDLLDLPQEERLALGQRAAARIHEHFSLPQTITRYEELYARHASSSG